MPDTTMRSCFGSPIMQCDTEICFEDKLKETYLKLVTHSWQNALA